MNIKKAICLIAGILLIVAGAILLYMGMGSGDNVIKVAACSIMVAGVSFLMEGLKNKEHKK